MTVTANPTGFDTQTVLCMRTCTCSCRAEMQMQLDEVEVPMHELDLVRLADMSDLPVHRACSYCGRDTVALWRIAAVIPEESWLRALVHVRKGKEQSYALVGWGDSEEPAAAAKAIFDSLPDDQRRQQVVADEEALLRQWGRPLSIQAFVRSSFAGFLGSGKAARIITLGSGSIAYEFARNDDDIPTEADIADFLTSACWSVDAKALLFVDADEGIGQAGSLVECLGPLRPALETATIVGIVDAGLVEHDLREALQVVGLTCFAVEGEFSDTVLHVTDGSVGASLPVRAVAHEAVRDGRTIAEAAALAAERLTLLFAAIHNGQLSVPEAAVRL